MLLALPMPPSEVFALTQAQKQYLLGHPRTKQGEFRAPAKPAPSQPVPSLKRDLAILAQFKGMMRPEKYRAAVQEVRRRWLSNNNHPGPGP
jgi:hypothetical protein